MSFDPPLPRTIDEYDALPATDLPRGAVDRSTIPVPIGPERRLRPLVPNISDWRAGDVILVRAGSRLRPSPVAIYQSLVAGLPKGSAAFTHVGVYDGDGHVWEANPAYNIRMSTVASVLGKRARFRVSRLKDTRIDPARLAEICRHLRDTRRYPSYADFIRPQIALKLGSRLLKRGAIAGPDPAAASDSLVCSSFVFHALNIAGSRPVQINQPFIVPADFASPAVFHPVPVSWCRTNPVAGGTA